MEEQMIEHENKQNKEKIQKNKTKKYDWQKIGLSVLVIAVIFILGFYWGKNYAAKRVEVKEVVKNMTENWVLYESEKYGFSFKHPKELQVNFSEKNSLYQIINNNKEAVINLRVNGSRVVDSKELIDAIQISIPFDKKNYLVFSTSTENSEKEIFYNIAATLEM